MARHMPKVVAPWVAGRYDNDKSVSRAADESFRRVFSSQEKMKNVWRLYQISILEYARDVVVKEAANTLSDERTTSPDDSSAKYSRVVSASIMMVMNLMETISEVDIEKSRALLKEYLDEEKLWRFASDSDASVRRALYRLLGTILARYKDTLNPSTISASVLMSGLNATQSGSALDFAKVLALLSVEIPDVWTAYYSGSGKKSAANRLCHFLKKGSQGGPPDFWSQIAELLPNLPPSILIKFADDESSKRADGEKEPLTPVLSALHEGLNNRDEPRGNRFAAWSAYLTASDLTLSSLSNADSRRRILRSSILPILVQYIKPSSENSQWAVTNAQGGIICVRACDQAILQDKVSFQEDWNALSNTIIEDLKTSLPEQAKDYARSQDQLSAEANRWYCLQSALLKGNGHETKTTIFRHTVTSEISSMIAILKARIGKPYGVAAALEMSIQNIPEIVLSDEGCKGELLRFTNEILPNLLFSPSAKYIVRILDHLDDSCDVGRSYDKCMQVLGEAPDSASKSIALQCFVSSPRLATTDALFAMVVASSNQAMKDDELMSWNVVMAAISNPVAPKLLTDDVLANVTEGLSIDSKENSGLHGLEMTMKHNSGKVTEFARSPKGSSLISKLLLLAESPDEGIAQRARSTSTTIEQALEAQGDVGQTTKSLIEIIKRGLNTADATSLSYAHLFLTSLNSSSDMSIVLMR